MGIIIRAKVKVDDGWEELKDPDYDATKSVGYYRATFEEEVRKLKPHTRLAICVELVTYETNEDGSVKDQEGNVIFSQRVGGTY